MRQERTEANRSLTILDGASFLAEKLEIKKVMVMEGLVPKKRRRNSTKMSHALRYELEESVAKTEPNNKSLK